MRGIDDHHAAELVSTMERNHCPPCGGISVHHGAEYAAIFRALAIFHSPDSDDWRLSLMTATPEKTEKGKVALSYSNPKRLSFFLGPNAKINTPTKFIIKKDKIIDFEDLKSRFSIEVVNKEFYREISELFTELVGGSVYKGKKKEEYKPLLKLPSVQDKSQTSMEFAVRLIGRIIFCWFLREKKSEQGKSLMPNGLLSIAAAKNNSDYYHKILEPIFFEVLNKLVKSRKDGYAKEPFASIPYLNGGLFSPHDDDYFSYNEGKQAINHNVVVIPDEWLIKFFEVLETYNFTIDENTSFDEELSIDPEMLGRIFENLLAEINPETGESARKSTGSYYTPRVIVDYMVDESLLLYLKTQTQIDEAKLKAVVSYDLNDDEKNPLTENEKQQIIGALEKVKILDPACGSGAFPIGALQKIVFILQQVDSEGKLWFKKQIKNTSPEIKRVFEREFAYKNFDYIRKLGIIRENIYGVDIQPIATEISRLRCFLTLVVDERIQENLENRGLEPLPNLDFKFVTANTLIGLPGSQAVSQMGLFEDDAGIRELKELRDMYFNASGIERDQLKLQFVQAQNRMFQRLISEGRGGHAELSTKLTAWDPFSHKSASWFDSEWMFGVKDGFDIVIANPPYGIKFTKSDNPQLANQYRDILKGEVESYILFYHKGLMILHSKGYLCYITPDSWFTNKGASPFREYITDNHSIIDVFDCYKPFDGAKDTRVHTVLISKLKIEGNIKIKQVFPSNTGVIYRDYEIANSIIRAYKGNEWRFYITKYERNIFNKMESISEPLEKLFNIKYGLRTGDNAKYVSEIKTEFPLIAGADIASLYEINWKPKYLKQTDGLPEGYFREYFSDKKIIIQYVRTNSLNINARWIEAAYVEGNYIPLNSLNYVYEKSKDYSLLYLLGVLNSFLLNRYYRAYYTDVNVKPTYLSQLPIPKISIQKQKPFIEIVDGILAITKSSDYLKSPAKKEEVKKCQKQIDKMVYKLYGLTEEEIQIVEGE